jgi:hypothetical protein
LLLALAGEARADDALTLPRGVGRVRVKPIYSFFNHRWDQNGRSELVTGDLDNRDLNSDVFQDLSILERIYGSQASSLSLGTSRVQSRVDLFVLAMAAEYGITDWLTVGLIVPVVHARHSLRTLALDPVRSCSGERCGLGKNLGDTNISVEDSKYLPLDHDKDSSTKLLQPLTRDDVQDILANDLGYQRLGDWSGSGVGDIELGVKMRLLRLRFWTTAIQTGVRLPTGATDDPNNLLDIGFGDGQTDIGLYWQNDFEPLRNLRLNLTLRYTAQLPDYERKRVPTSANVPLAKPEASEDVWRDLGDIFEVDILAAYRVLPVLTPFVRYAVMLKMEDQVRGNLGLSYRALMDETAQQNHQLEVGVTFSTIPWVEKGRFRLPLDASLTYSRSLAGINNAAIANVLALELAGYFKVF